LIEEPPDNTIFILVASSEENILPTVLSRCQLVRVPRLQKLEIETALINRAKIDPDKAAQVALLADGNYREALHLLQHSDADFLGQIREWLNAILKNGPVAQMKWVDDMSKMGREPQKQFLKYFNHLLEHSIRLKILGNDLALDPDLKDFALRINKIAGVTQMEAMIEELDKAVYYIERNANPKMLFMAMGIKFYHIIQNKTLILTEA
jgi:DNA polymerase-3 subunit delta'